jgi:hypothetical protein
MQTLLHVVLKPTQSSQRQLQGYQPAAADTLASWKTQINCMHHEGPDAMLLLEKKRLT